MAEGGEKAPKFWCRRKQIKIFRTICSLTWTPVVSACVKLVFGGNNITSCRLSQHCNRYYVIINNSCIRLYQISASCWAVVAVSITI
jgi:hypothetical protein